MLSVELLYRYVGSAAAAPEGNRDRTSIRCANRVFHKRLGPPLGDISLPKLRSSVTLRNNYRNLGRTTPRTRKCTKRKNNNNNKKDVPLLFFPFFGEAFVCAKPGESFRFIFRPGQRAATAYRHAQFGLVGQWAAAEQCLALCGFVRRDDSYCYEPAARSPFARCFPCPPAAARSPCPLLSMSPGRGPIPLPAAFHVPR